MTIDLNTAPYYDDFSENKNFVKILFKPEMAVQSRELTQLQTAIQKQISRFGSHIFKDGSIVLNGQTTTNNINWIDVTTTNASSALNKRFTGQTSGAVGIVFKVEQIANTTARLYFIYANGLAFQQAETILAGDSTTYTIVSSESFSGDGVSYSITDSVFFVKGYFVYCEAQTIILTTDTSVTFNKKVGLNIVESIVTYAHDETLLDPAQGSYNFAAPGADRLTIALTLAAYNFDAQDQGGETEDFIELSRFENSALIYNVTAANYSDLETTMARRTYDESGDYTVRPFGMNIVSHIRGDDTKLSVGIEPGKAYVKGYEFETIATNYIDLDKARDTSFKNEFSVQVDYGSYILVDTPSGGSINYNNNVSVTLKAGATTIGTANVKGLAYHAVATYKLYLFNVVFTGAYSAADLTSITNGTWTVAVKTAAAEYANGVYLVKNQNKPYIVQLPNSPIKTLKSASNGGVAETDYFAYKTFTVDFVSGSATLGAGSNETLPSTTLTDYIVVFPSGAVKTVTGVTGTATSRTVTISDTTSTASVSVFTKVSLTFQNQKQKSLLTGTKNSVAVTSNAISLDKADCFELVSIIARDTAGSPVGNMDVTKFFDFNNGQLDDLYDHGWVKLKSGASIPAVYDVLDITFTYFTQSSSSGFFSVDSYSGIDYNKIPSYTTSNGRVIELRDCLDFRPRRDDGAATISGNTVAIPSEYVQVDYDYYLPRIDKLVLTKERRFDIVKGIPTDYPAIPNDLFDAMTLYVINVPAYTQSAGDVSFSYIDNRRYTMRDIGKIEKRVERMEYYTSLSMLEKQAKDETIYDSLGVERFKNGILVDSFAGHSVGDVNNSDYACSIENESRTMRPRFASFSFNYVANTLTNISKRNELLTLPYTTETLVTQPFATGVVNLNPYMVFSWNGVVTLDPPSDTWVDTFTKPDVTVNMNGENDVFASITDNVSNPASVGVRWNDWQTINRGVVVSDNISSTSSTNTSTSGGRVLETTNTVVTNNQATTVNETLSRSGVAIATSSTSTITRDLGTRVVDMSVVPYIRPRLVKFAAKNMQPDTQLIAFFDGVDISTYCSAADELVFTNGAVQRTATKVRTTNLTKTAEIILTKNDRAFIILDAGSPMFTVADTVEWLVGGVWMSSSSIVDVQEHQTLETNAFGDIAGTFYIPSNNSVKFRTGERVFRLADAAGTEVNTAAEVKYVASGMSQSMERTIVATKVASVSIYPTSETQTRSNTTTNNIVVSNTSVVTDVTPPPPPLPAFDLGCGQSQSGGGSTGRHEFVINLGTDTGTCGISYNAFSVPDRYTIIWDGKEYTTGFVGSSTFNTALSARGFPNVTGAGSGSLTFNKTKAYPQTAIVIVDAPLPGTGWRFGVVCPGASVVAPPPTPAAAASASIAATTRTITRAWLSGTSNVGSGTTAWRSNAGISASARYKLVSLTSSNPALTVSAPAIAAQTLYASGAGAPFTMSMSIAGTVTALLTATWQYVSGDETIPTILKTLTATRTITATVNRRQSGGNGGRSDPVAQTFFVDANTYPNGVFVDSVDLFFKKKSDTAPVTVQLRPCVNGYPSANTVMPFGVCVKDAYDISTSTDGTVATNFKFDNIVHLSPGEYSFVAIADSQDYEIFTATIGEFSINYPDQRVTTQATLGSMFKSQNASTWTPVQEEDVKFTLHKCVFDTAVTGTAILDTNIATTNGDVSYDMFYTMGEVVDFSQTNIAYEFKPNNQATWTQYQLGANVELSERKTLSTNDKTSLQFKTILTTNDRNITPIVDTDRLSSVLVQNLINNDSTNETNSFGGSATSKYITRKVKLNPGFESTDLKVYFNANRPSGTSFKVYYKVATSADSVFDDNGYVEMTLESAGTYSETSFTEYKYKTPYTVSGSSAAFANGDRFDTFAIKIVMLSSNTVKVPKFRDLRVIALDD